MAGLAACLCCSALFRREGAPTAVGQPPTTDEDAGHLETWWAPLDQTCPSRSGPVSRLFGRRNSKLFDRRWSKTAVRAGWSGSECQVLKRSPHGCWFCPNNINTGLCFWWRETGPCWISSEVQQQEHSPPNPEDPEDPEDRITSSWLPPPPQGPQPLPCWLFPDWFTF